LGALRAVIADLTHVLPKSGIAIEGNLITTQSKFLDVDVWHVLAALERGASIEMRRYAESLWRGGFLNGFSVPACPGFTDWQDRITRVMHYHYRELLGRLVEDSIDEDRPELALRYAYARVREDPLDEEACQDLMILLADGGDRPEALREYEAYAKRIQTELRIPPDESITELAELIRRKRHKARRHLSVSTGDLPTRLAVLVRRLSDSHSVDEDHHVVFEEALYCALAGAPEIEMISRSSTLQFGDSSCSIGEIAERVHADFILTGRAFQEHHQGASEWLCEMQLIQGNREAVVKTFSVRDHSHVDLAIRLSEMVTTCLTASSDGRSAGRGCDSASGPNDTDRGVVWRLRGRHLMRMDTGESFDQALIAFRKAVELNPRDATGWAGVAVALYTAASNPWWHRPQCEAYPEAAEACAKALAINPSEPTALRVRARLAIDTHWDFGAAQRDLERAVEIAPTDSDVLVAYAEAMAIQRKLDRANEFAEKAYRLNPADYFTLATRYWVGLASGRYKQAIEAIDQIEELIPHPFLNQWARGLAYNIAGQPEITISTTEDSFDLLLETTRAPLASVLAVAYAMVGRIEDAIAVLNRLEERARSAEGFRVPIASVLTALGRYNDALDTLDTAVVERDSGINFLALVPAFRPLFDHPRYQRVLQKAGIPEW
jgi:tetratricopeptide (TPR) repeat protein